MKNATLALIALALLLGGEGQVRAEFIIGLYNTGASASGALAGDGSTDSHYGLISSADKSINMPGSAFVADSSKFPFVPDGWLPNGPLSKWIDPVHDQSIGNPPGDYIYSTTFQLLGGNATSVVISGRWTMDNFGKDILINGHSTGIFYDAPGDYSFKAFNSFVLPSNYFIDGANSLDFVVNNTDNGNGNTPTGLRVELSGQITAVPEPATLTMLGIGTAGLAGYGWRRRKQLVPS